MRVLLAVVVLFVVSGCASTPDLSYSGCMRALYAKTHKNKRPEDIKAAVQRGELMAGMTKWEAQLCQGGPDRVEKTETGQVWIYEEMSKGGESSLYDITVITMKITFEKGDEGLRVSDWWTNVE